MRSSKEESSQNIIWFACYHKDEDSKEMKRTRLRDLKDSEENLVERKITQDASGNRSVRRIAPLEKNGLLVTANETQIALFRFGIDTVYAINKRCPHKGGPLHMGDIEDLGKERKRLCVVRFKTLSTYILHSITKHKNNRFVLGTNGRSVWRRES